ncbi:MAG: Stp1/IreP family PP2C-type Ser/Thr phosphatase, partial [Gaiellaceae bacterium]
MRLEDSAGRTDPGRKRRRNEDAYVLEPPLFVVADGMGGAQAGEVASRLAAAAFREYHEADELEPEARVRAIVQEANRRIYERALADAEASGMGTTITAALVEPGAVTIGHVGDSRAYRLREGKLEQLTQDHSLVADLIRSGRLTPEEAETHPQRSVITRALGTDAEVDVDTLTVEASPGDVFLLCSDGLTTMVPDEEILEIVGRAKDLESAAKALVKAANRSGGEDNVTVVLFSVSPEEAALEETLASGDGRGTGDDLEDTLTGLEAPTLPAATAMRQPDEWGPPPDRPEPGEEAKPKRRPRWGRRILLGVVTVIAVLGLAAAALWALGRAHFVGADADGRVAVYQGLPWDLGGGLQLYRERYVSQLRAVQLDEQ